MNTFGDRLRMRHVAAAAALVIALSGETGAQTSPQTIGDVFDRVYRSVVLVRATERDVPSEPGEPGGRVSSFGSGVLISQDGRILTAAHLVHAASEIHVEFWNGQRSRARVVSSAPGADVSLLQAETVPNDAPVAHLADSDRARIGDQVFIVGAPYGLTHTLTVGHVSGRQKPGQMVTGFVHAEFLQTDAAINQGNSGGPMFNITGEVLGVVSHIISKSGGFEGLGFVVTSNVARQLLLERGAAWHGIDAVLLTGDQLKVFNLPEPGVLIQRVVENSFAAKLGLRGGFVKATIGDRTLIVGGDVVLRVQGVPVAEGHRLKEMLGRLQSGERLTMTIVRQGRLQELSMTVP